MIRASWSKASAALLAVLALLVILTVQDYGVTVDEEHGKLNGEYFLRWYASGFTDDTINTDGNHYLYGSFFNALTAVVARLSPLGYFDSAHFLIALTGLLGIFVAWRIGNLLAGPMAGFLSALILSLTPVYYGHMFMNPKDIPFAVLCLAVTYYLLRAYDELPGLSTRSIGVLGLLIGLALGIRIGAVMLFGYCGVLVVLYLIAGWRKSRGALRSPFPKGVGRAVLSLLVVAVISWVVMLVWWPYAQLNPLLNPLRAFSRAANFTDFPASVLFEGRWIPVNGLPLHYLPKSFLISLPEIYAVALAGGLAAMAIALRRRRETKVASDADSDSKLLFLVFTIAFPLVTALVLRPILYDANRHFLFIVPPLAVLAGIALASLFQAAVHRAVKAACAVAFTALAGLTVFDMVRLHPYQYVFYNRSTGGLPAALGRYETDYWGQSHKEGVEWLMRNYRPDASPGSIRVANTAIEFQTSYYLERGGASAARFASVRKNATPHVILSITRWNAHLDHPGRVLHAVERLGVRLLYVVEVRPPELQ